MTEMPRETRRKPCERCGRPLAVGGRKRPIFVCLDCKSADPEYMRMRGAA